MKIIAIISLASMLLLASLNGHAQELSDSAALKFESTLIIDSVKEDNNTTMRYYFRFTNVGKKPLIIDIARGSDPDFPFYYPREPILPGKRDSIGVILVPQQLNVARLHRYYTVEYNKYYRISLELMRILPWKKPGY